jgi:hypothetical protein
MKYRVVSPHGHAFDIDADAVDCALSSSGERRREFNLFWVGKGRTEENCVARVPSDWAVLATGLRQVPE